jgi:hypothetical protein
MMSNSHTGSGQNRNCHIDDFIVIIGDCLSDSTYILYLEFNYGNLPSDSVHILANGNDFGNYPVQEGSIYLEDFPVCTEITGEVFVP